jgi:hypothetical protein
MANASKNHLGAAALVRGKGSGTGAMTELPEGILEENMVLSNRDKSLHSQERGLDSKAVQTEQYQDHAGNRRNFDQQGMGGSPNSSGMSAPMSTTSSADSSLERRADGPEGSTADI